MANIRKTFNFRNGVQVDEDNFIVNANGLVGIGTSVPTEFLDVRGTAKVVGLVTASDVFVSGVATITEVKVGTAISISGSGIKADQFYGDGSSLSKLPTSQWLDVDVGLGYTSIYSAGSVGVGTTDPRNTFQVGGDPGAAGKKGVGINTIGNIHASGIVTAASFRGPLVGNVTGDLTGDLTGEVNAAKFDTNNSGVVVSGVGTFSDGVTFAGTSKNVNWITGGELQFDDDTKLVTGASRDLQIYTQAAGASCIHNSNTDLLIGNNVFVGGNYQIRIQARSSKNSILCHPDEYVKLYYNGNEKLTTTDYGVKVTGIASVTDATIADATVTNSVLVGTGGTALSVRNIGKIGIGTGTATADLHILKPQGTSVKVNADSGIPNIKIGIGATAKQGCLRFNNEPNSFDVVNLDTGDLNFVIDGDNNNGVGNFTWNDVTAERMRLTYDGKLGINEDDPAHQLHVVGTSTVTSNAWVGGNLDVKGNVSVGGTISGTIVFTDAIETNINKTSGVSTVSVLNVINGIGFNNNNPQTKLDFLSATAAFNTIGIGTTNPATKLDVKGSAYIESIGINTNTIKSDASFDVGNFQIAGSAIELFQSNLKLDSLSKVGVGTYGDQPGGVVDLRKGNAQSNAWVFVPHLTTTERNTKTNAAGSGISTGAIIYNTSSDRVELFLPPSNAGGSPNVAYWVGLATAA